MSSKVYIVFNDIGEPDTWGVIETPNSVEFDESELPGAYELKFSERKYQFSNGQFILRDIE